MTSDAPRKITLRRPGARSPPPPVPSASASAPVSPRAFKQPSFTGRSATPPVVLPSQAANQHSHDFKISVHSPTSGAKKPRAPGGGGATSPSSSSAAPSSSSAQSAYTSLSSSGPVKLRLKKNPSPPTNDAEATSPRGRNGFSTFNRAPSPLSALTQTSPRHTTGQIQSFSPTHAHTISRSKSPPPPASAHREWGSKSTSPTHSRSGTKSPPYSPTASASGSAGIKPRPPSVPPPRAPPTRPSSPPMPATTPAINMGMLSDSPSSSRSTSPSASSPSMSPKSVGSNGSSTSNVSPPQSRGRTTATHALSPRNPRASHVRPVAHAPSPVPPRSGVATASHAKAPRQSPPASLQRFNSFSPRTRRAFDVLSAATGAASSPKNRTTRSPSASPASSPRGSPRFGAKSPGLSSLSSSSLTLKRVSETYVHNSKKSPASTNSSSQSPPFYKSTSNPEIKSKFNSSSPTTKTPSSDPKNSVASIYRHKTRRRSSGGDEFPASSPPAPKDALASKPVPRPPPSRRKHARNRSSTDPTEILENLTASVSTELGSSSGRKPKPPKYAPPFATSASESSLAVDELPRGVKISHNSFGKDPRSPKSTSGSHSVPSTTPDSPRGPSGGVASSARSTLKATPTPHAKAARNVSSSGVVDHHMMSQTVPMRATFHSASSEVLRRAHDSHKTLQAKLMAKLMEHDAVNNSSQTGSSSSIGVHTSSAPATPAAANGQTTGGVESGGDSHVSPASSSARGSAAPAAPKRGSGLLTVYDPLDAAVNPALQHLDSDSQPGSRRSSGWRRRLRRLSHMGRRTSGSRGTTPSPRGSPRFAGGKSPRSSSASAGEDDEGADGGGEDGTRADSVSRMYEKRQTRSRRHAHTSADHEETAQHLDHASRMNLLARDSVDEHRRAPPVPPRPQRAPAAASPNNAANADDKAKLHVHHRGRTGRKPSRQHQFAIEPVALDHHGGADADGNDADGFAIPAGGRARGPSLPADLRTQIEIKGATKRRVPESILVKETLPEIPFLQEIRTVNTSKPGFWKKLRRKKKPSIPSATNDARGGSGAAGGGGVDFSLVRQHLEAEIGEDFSHLMQENILMRVHGEGAFDLSRTSTREGSAPNSDEEEDTLEPLPAVKRVPSGGTSRPGSRQGSLSAFRSSLSANSTAKRHHHHGREGSQVPLGASSRHTTLTRKKFPPPSNSRNTSPSVTPTSSMTPTPDPPAVHVSRGSHAHAPMPPAFMGSPAFAFSNSSAYSSSPSAHKIPDLENAPSTKLLMEKSASLGKRTGTMVSSRIVGAGGGGTGHHAGGGSGLLVGGSVRVRSSSGTVLPTELASEIQQVDITNRSFWNKLKKKPKHRDDSGYDTDEEVVSFVDLHKSDNEVAHRYQKESFARIRQLARTYADANETANGGGDANDASSSDAYDEASNTLSGTDHHSLHTSFRSASSKRLSKRTSPPHSHSSKPSVSVSMSYSVSMSSKSSESKDSNGSGSGSSGGTQILRSSPKGGVGGNSLQRGAPPLPPSSQKKAKNLTLTRSGATAALTKRAHHSHSRKSSRDRRRDKV